MSHDGLRHDKEHGRHLSEDMAEVDSVAGCDGGANGRPLDVAVDVDKVVVVVFVAVGALRRVGPGAAEIEERRERGLVLEHDF